ncbi:MAG: hypothetical protein AAGB48_01950 [Planctomycetota bacterium]
MCGRRFGKTVFVSSELADVAIDGGIGAYFAPTYKLTADVYRKLLSTLYPVVSRSDKTEGRIELITGGAIDFWTLDHPDAGRSRYYDLAAIDEAGLVRHLEDAWNGAIRPTLADRKGRAWFVGSPKGRGYFHKLFMRGQDESRPDWRSWRFRTIDNPAISSSEVADAKRDMPPDVFAQEFEGVPADDQGNPFGMENIRACTGEMSTKPPVVFGVDLARSVDWTVVIGLDEGGAICRFYRVQGGSWGAIQEDVAAIVGDTPCLVDQTGVGSPLMEQIARACPRAEGFTFTNQSKQQIMEGLQFAFHRREIRITDDPVLIGELEGFGYEYRAGRIYFGAEGTDHDDCVCALALAWHALDRVPRIDPGFLVPNNLTRPGMFG